MRETSFATESKNLASGATVTPRAANWQRWGILYARFALGASFLSGIADRFGLYTGRNVGYGNFAGFVSYTAKVNYWACGRDGWRRGARCCWRCSELRWRFRLESSRRWTIRCFRRRRERLCWHSMGIVRQLREREWQRLKHCELKLKED
jgi:hypothetical protein